MVLDGLKTVLGVNRQLEVVGTAKTLAEFRTEVESWRPAIVVTDYILPDGRGTEVVALAQAVVPEARVLLISGDERPAVMEDAIASGCAGFMSKNVGTRQLADTIVNVGRGATVFPVELHGRIANHTMRSGPALTAREREVLSRLASAESVGDMVEGLGISEHTVRNHVRNVLAKLQARSQLDAVVIGVKSGLVDIR